MADQQPYKRPQIGHILILGDSTDRANLLHWLSIKCKRIMRSVLALELYTMTYRFDIATSIKAIIDQIL